MPWRFSIYCMCSFCWDSYQELTSALHGSILLFKEFKCHCDLQRTKDYHNKTFKAILSLFLCSASRIRCFSDSRSKLKDAYDKEIKQAINALCAEISSLLNTVYGESFGRCGYEFYQSDSMSELTVQSLCYLHIYVYYNCLHVDVDVICQGWSSTRHSWGDSNFVAVWYHWENHYNETFYSCKLCMFEDSIYRQMSFRSTGNIFTDS